MMTKFVKVVLTVQTEILILIVNVYQIPMKMKIKNVFFANILVLHVKILLLFVYHVKLD